MRMNTMYMEETSTNAVEELVIYISCVVSASVGDTCGNDSSGCLAVVLSYASDVA